jgi:predicted RNase H-like nuclease (RuvC/YqgF family)
MSTMGSIDIKDIKRKRVGNDDYRDEQIKRAENDIRTSIAELKLAIENIEKEKVILSDRASYYLTTICNLEKKLNAMTYHKNMERGRDD